MPPTKVGQTGADSCNRRTLAPIAISLVELYRIDDAKIRLGWSNAAYLAALRRGLQVLESGKRRYVTGEEILRFLQAETKSRLGR